MSDIIKDAKQLLEDATPGPWEVDIDGLEVYSTVDGDAVAHAQTPIDADLIAAAPELAQALAEETWEYIAEWCDNGVWAPIEIEMFDGTFPNLQAARGYIKVAKTRGAYENTRIVRRRVSPVEVVNE